MTAVVRVAALIRSNLFHCMFCGGICDICSICGVVVVVFLFPTTTIITNTTNIVVVVALATVVLVAAVISNTLINCICDTGSGVGVIIWL